MGGHLHPSAAAFADDGLIAVNDQRLAGTRVVVCSIVEGPRMVQ